jgi:hypothetical protein
MNSPELADASSGQLALLAGRARRSEQRAAVLF